jgi:hypothetical protein
MESKAKFKNEYRWNGQVQTLFEFARERSVKKRVGNIA